MKKTEDKFHRDDAIDKLAIVNESTPFSITEAFRTAYTNILYLPIEGKSKKIAFTSAVSGEGKTYVSINMAITLAQNGDGKKVLLIDADMRKPRVANLLGLDSVSNGLSEYLAGVNDTPNILSTNTPNLSVLLSGQQSMNPIGLLNSKRMKELISLLEEDFSYIIIDTPPVNIVSDAVIIGKFVDGYILVTRAEVSDVNSIGDAVDSLNQAGVNIFGLILTDLDPKGKANKKSSYYKYGY
jgi:capsular exopolysaccharide synthesis family protein